MKRRINGQLWIDKSSPHRLKYHYDEIDYTVEVSATYTPGPGVTLPAGSIVKLKEGSSNTIAPAIFPDDLNAILGVTINESNEDNPDNSVSAVAQTGYMVISGKENIEKVFPVKDDLDVTKNKWGDTVEKGTNTQRGAGAPIYWFIGGTFKQGDDQYEYIDSSREGYQGKMTFRTPSGYKWNVKEVEDSSMNLGYDNLPIIGTVASYTYDEKGILEELYIHLNFSKFDSSIEWNWPYLHQDSPLKEPEGCGYLKEGKHTFRHGLFADNRYYSELSSYINVMAADDSTAGSNNVVNVQNTNIITGSDRKTEITLNTPETMLYRISGEIHYKFDKES